MLGLLRGGLICQKSARSCVSQLVRRRRRTDPSRAELILNRVPVEASPPGESGSTAHRFSRRGCSLPHRPLQRPGPYILAADGRHVATVAQEVLLRARRPTSNGSSASIDSEEV